MSEQQRAGNGQDIAKGRRGQPAKIVVSVVLVVSQRQMQSCRDTMHALMRQTFRNFEIIPVFWGMDGPASMFFAGKDSEAFRGRLVMDAGSGAKNPSEARNIGIRKARGKYVVFPQCGDTYREDYLETLVKSITHFGADPYCKGFLRIPVQLGICGYEAVSPETQALEDADAASGTRDSRTALAASGQLQYETAESGVRTIEREDLLCKLFYLTGYQGFLWNKIFRLDIIKKHRVYFDEKIFCHEDQLFLVSYVLHIDAARMLPEHVCWHAAGSGRMPTEKEKRSGACAFSKMALRLWRYPDARWLCKEGAKLFRSGEESRIL